MTAQTFPAADTITRGRVLVVDDDPQITGLIALYLRKHGYEATIAGDGDTAERLLRDESFDLALLDIMLPGPDGLELVRSVRRRGDLPVIFVSARTSDIDKVAGLHLGADDYVTKPFSPSELMARVESVLRRAGRSTPNPSSAAITIADLTVDPDSRVAGVQGKPVALTPKEFELLSVLCRFVGVALDRVKLLDLIWGSNFYSMRTVDIHILRLRKKLSGAGIVIETVWGSGYRLREAGDA